MPHVDLREMDGGTGEEIKRLKDNANWTTGISTWRAKDSRFAQAPVSSHWPFLSRRCLLVEEIQPAGPG